MQLYDFQNLVINAFISGMLGGGGMVHDKRSYKTHYRPYRGWVFTGQMTQQQCQNTEGSSSPKDRLQPHQVHLTMLQYYTCMQYTDIQKIHTYIHKNESKHSEMEPVKQNPIQRPVRSVHVCALHCAQLLHTILHGTDLIIFPLTLQTITIAPMMSVSGKGGKVMQKHYVGEVRKQSII